MENLHSHLRTGRRAVNKLKRLLFRPYVLWNLIEITAVIVNPLPLTPKLSSIGDFYQRYPRRVRKLFRSLNLERQGLERVKAAVEQKDWVSACEALVNYYQTDPSLDRIRLLGSAYQMFSDLPIDQILTDTFTFQQQTAKVPRCKDGFLDWAFSNGDREWTWFLNRHYHLLNLLYTYQQTGNPRCTTYLNQHLLDWIVSSFSKPRLWWAQWRGRESALRVIHWSSVFYGLSSPAELSPVVRLLMLSSLLDHACYLRYLHHWGGNWLCREMHGLATIALCWSEFKMADSWLDLAQHLLLQELTLQVYPDGVHKELTSHYHRVVLRDYQTFIELSELTQKPIPAIFRQRLEQMLDYLVYSITPTGHGVLNNDSDQEDNRPLIKDSAIFYERADWLYIASHGQLGQEPKGSPSRFFPWAGQVISRDGWNGQAHYSFFDIGPVGINYHIHYDKLHLSVIANGRHLLVDSGRYRYRKDRFWHYFHSSASHNVILIDGKGQGVDYQEQTYPLTNHCTFGTKVDFAWGCFKGPFLGLTGKASHSRAIVYLHDQYWVVVDYIESDRPRRIEPLWHFHPDCTVEIAGETAESKDPDVGNLGIIPASPFSWQVRLVEGQYQPLQGWWSREYNHLVPNPTVIYSAEIAGSRTFAWVLYPEIGKIPEIKVKLLPTPIGSVRIAVTVPGQKPDEIAVSMAGEQPIPLSGNLLLKGMCAVLPGDSLPIAVQGKILQCPSSNSSSPLAVDRSLPMS